MPSTFDYPPGDGDDEQPNMDAFEQEFNDITGELNEIGRIPDLMSDVAGFREAIIDLMDAKMKVADPRGNFDRGIVETKRQLYDAAADLFRAIIEDTPSVEELKPTLTRLLNDEFDTWVEALGELSEGRFDHTKYDDEGDSAEAVEGEIEEHIVEDDNRDALAKCVANHYHGIVDDMLEDFEEFYPEEGELQRSYRDYTKEEIISGATVLLGKAAFQAVTIAAGILIAERFKRNR